MRVSPHLSAQMIITVLIAGAMLALIVPLPGWLLDLLVAANLAVSLAVFALALLVRTPSRLSGLPGLMVISSLGRVVLALAVARNILLGGGGGEVVSALGAMGGGAGWLAGIVVVLMVALIDLLVIAVGMVRVSEVLARFALDALPGRQMAIDAAVADSRISAEEASVRAQQVDAECAFYGAMDGAARFLRGDCIATIIIVAATPLVAVLIEQAGGGAGATELSSYLQIATGHGLVILLPALLVGGAGAMALARAGSDKPFGAEIAEQLLVQPVALAAAAIVLFVVALLAPAARVPLIIMAVAIAAVVVIAGRRAAQQPPAAEPQPPQQSHNRIEIGLGLVHLIREEDFATMLSQMRQRVQRSVGFEVAAFVVADNGELEMHQTAVVAGGQRVALCTIRPSRLLAVGRSAPEMAGAEPARCGPHILGAWIRPDDEADARSQGTEVLSPVEALLMAVEGRLVACADRIFDTQYAAEMLRVLAQTHPAVVQAAAAEGMDPVALANLGSALLAEGLGLHDAARILQAAVESLREGVSQRALAESVRRRLSEQICRGAAPDGEILAIEMEPAVAQDLLASYDKGQLAIPPQRAEQWLRLLAEYGREAVARKHPIVILCDGEVRPAVSKLVAESGQNLLAMAFDELQPGYSVQRLATVSEVELSAQQAPAHEGEE